VRIARLAKHLVLAVVATGLVIAGAELVLRALMPSEYEPYLLNPQRVYGLRPQFEFVYRSPLGEFPPVRVYHNAAGLREEREISAHKAPGEFRILLIGDSYVEARQVPYGETMAQQMEQLLNARAAADGASTRYVVINGGVGGYSPLLEYLFLVQAGLALAPDLVLVYFVGNDVSEDHERGASGRVEYDGDGLPVRAWGAAPPPALSVAGVRRAIGQMRLAELARLSLARVRSTTEAPGRVDRERLSVATDPFALFKAEYDAADERAWDATRRYLAGMQAVLRDAGVPLVLAVVPAPPQVGAGQWRLGKTRWGLAPDETIASTRMQDVLREHARAQGTYFLDLLPALKPHANAPLVFDYDGHWTPLGNRLAAEASVAFLAERGLVPPAPPTIGR
jgi:hypothetical protein